MYGGKKDSHQPHCGTKLKIMEKNIGRLKESAHVDSLLNRPSIEINTIWELLVKKGRTPKKISTKNPLRLVD